MHAWSSSALHPRSPCTALRSAPCRKPFAAARVSGPTKAPRLRRPPAQRDPAPEETSRRAKKLEIWKNQLAKLASNPRAVAVSQLMRIEEEGAFVGLVGGSPGGSVDTAASQDEQDDMLATRHWTDKLSDRDTRLVTELVAGVVRWRRRLDYLICHLTKQPDVGSLDAPLRQVLRMALYELLEMGRPSHVINEHVQLTKRVINSGAGGFANGVLRSAVRLIESHHLPQPPAPPPHADVRAVADALGVATSHPTWMVERWLRQLGSSQTLQLLKCNNTRPTHSLRVTPACGCSPPQLCAKLLENGAEATPSAYLPHDFVRVKSGLQSVLAMGLLAQGAVQVQDEAAGMVVAMLDPQPGEALLDACAAPGGKTMFAAARMGGQGHILALDVSAARLKALAASARLQGYGTMVATHAADFRQMSGGPRALAAAPAVAAAPSGTGARAAPPLRLQPAGAAAAVGGGRAPLPWQAQRAAQPPGQSQPAAAQQQGKAAQEAQGSAAEASSPSPAAAGRTQAQALLQGQFDRVLLDAPCSGTGVLAKRADLRWRRQPGDLRQLAELQDGLLEAAAGWVKPGGVLVYSTCSIEPEENQERVARFLERHPEFAPEPPPPAVGICPSCLTAEGYLQMLPHVHGTDGAFAARLRRREAAAAAGR